MPEITLPKIKRNYVTITPKNQDESIFSLDESTVLSLFKMHGAILFRGFNIESENSEIFARFTEQFCAGAAFNESTGRDVINQSKNIQTVNLGQLPFPLHPELSRAPWKPDVCFFSCIIPPVSGGETTICDGTKIVQNLPNKIVKSLKDQRIIYHNICTPSALKYWFGTEAPNDETLQNPPENCPYTFSRKGDLILNSFIAPFFHRTMFTKQLAFGNFLLFARRRGVRDNPLFADGNLIGDEVHDIIKSTSDKLTVPVKWEKNDILMLDNSRFLHGRNEIIDPSNRLIISYFGYLKFAELASKLAYRMPWRTEECHDFFRVMFQD
jgi:alpha-ketoglutarate-dependent taurine dioxygenase